MNTTHLDALLRFLEDDPEDIFIHYAIALEYAAMGQPEYIPGYQQLGSLLHQTGDIGEARRILREGITAAGRSGDQHARSEMEALLVGINGEEG